MLKLGLQAVLSIAILVFVASRVDWAGVGEVLSQADLGWVAISWLCAMGLTWLLSHRLSFFLKRLDASLPFADVWRTTWSGQFFNTLLPGAIGGDGVKMYELTRLHPDRKARAASAVLADRIYAVAGLAVLAFGVVLSGAELPFSLTDLRVSMVWLVLPLLGAAVVAVVCWQVRRTAVWLTFTTRVRQVFAAVRVCFSDTRFVVVSLAMAVGVHLANFSTVYLVARSLHVSFGYVDVLILMPVLLVAVMLPVSVNGHGIREALLVGYFTVAGISGPGSAGAPEAALSLSITLVAVDMFASLPGYLWYVMSRARTRSHV